MAKEDTGPKQREGRAPSRPPEWRPEPRETVSAMNGRPRSRRIPKGLRQVLRSAKARRGNVRNSVLSLDTKLRQSFKYKSEIRSCAAWLIHVACLLIMFLYGRLAMPCIKHENVRHATLLFCAEGVNVRTTGVEGKGKAKYEHERGRIL